MSSLALLLLLAWNATSSSSLTGNWMTSDKSVVHVYACKQDDLCVRLVAVGPQGEPQTDVNNPAKETRTRALCGLVIGSGFHPNGARNAKGGTIYDPESGNTYSAQMQVSGDTLKLRGFVGISLFGRTETWHRTIVPVAACPAAAPQS